MTLEHMKKLMNIYLDTLDTMHKDDWYTTERTFHSLGIDGFCEWLEDNGILEDQ